MEIRFFVDFSLNQKTETKLEKEQVEWVHNIMNIHDVFNLPYFNKAENFVFLWQRFSLHFTKFIRSTIERHKNSKRKAPREFQFNGFA